MPIRDIVGIFAFVAAFPSGCSDLFDLDPEIERTLHKRRREN